jgi:hypothetical protein
LATGVVRAGCGCDAGYACDGGCVNVIHHHHHARRHCRQCCQPPAPPQPIARELPPAGPVVETAAVRMMPMVATPMMYAAMPAQRVAYVEEAPRVREITCEQSSSRLAQLEDRFDLLHERVNALQATIATQTDILIQIKTKLDVIEQRK